MTMERRDLPSGQRLSRGSSTAATAMNRRLQLWEPEAALSGGTAEGGSRAHGGATDRVFGEGRCQRYCAVALSVEPQSTDTLISCR